MRLTIHQQGPESRGRVELQQHIKFKFESRRKDVSTLMHATPQNYLEFNGREREEIKDYILEWRIKKS